MQGGTVSKAGEHTRSEFKTLRDAMNLTLSRILMSFFMLKVSCFSKRIGKWGGTHRLQIGEETLGFLERDSMGEYSRALVISWNIFLWSLREGANYEGWGGVCFHILMDRFGLCNPLSTKHIPSCDVSDFNLVHSQLCKDVRC